MKIAAALLFERDAEGLPIELAARLRVTNDRTETRNEQNFDICELFRGIPSLLTHGFVQERICLGCGLPLFEKRLLRPPGLMPALRSYSHSIVTYRSIPF